MLEDVALELLGESGVAVPRFGVASVPGEAAEFAAALGAPVIVKALVPVGGRQKGGVVARAATPEEAARVAHGILGQVFKRFLVERVLVAEVVDVARELFLAITFDPLACSPVVLFSPEGGVEIEAGNGAQLKRSVVDITLGLRPFEARGVCRRAGLRGAALTAVADALVAAYTLFRRCDAQLLEVNPLVVTGEGKVVAVSGLVNVDDQAGWRQEGLLARQAQPPNNGWRPLTALEQEMRAINASDPTVGTIRFNEFPEGDVALMVTGGGAGLTALDAAYRVGLSPATTFDIKIGPIEEKMYLATRAVLRRPGLRGLVVGANFSNFVPIDVKVRGVVRALLDERVDTARFPVVMRFCGPNQEEGRRLAAQVPGLEYYDDTTTLEEAVARLGALLP